MARSKKSEFPRLVQEAAKFGKAFSHPARIAILKLLVESGEIPCTRIVSALPLAQSTVSQHLKELREAGILFNRACGKKSFYAINWEGFESCWASFRCLVGGITSSGLRSGETSAVSHFLQKSEAWHIPGAEMVPG